MALATGTETGGDDPVWRRANSATAADGNRAAGAPSAADFFVRLPRLSGKPLDGQKMGKLVRFEDSATGCFARVDLESRDPLFINVAQTGVLVRQH